jgi:hypothetical protein
MNSRLLLIVTATVLLVGASLAQMRGGAGGASGTGMGQPSAGGMQGSQTGMGSMGGMQGSQSGMGSMGQGGTTITPAQRRQVLHTTSVQDQKYQASAHAMSKVQGDLSRMQAHGHAANSASNGYSSGAGSGADATSGNNTGDDLSSDLQDLKQSNDDLASSLSSDQQAVVASKLRDLDKKTKEMQTLAQQLKSEMDHAPSDPKVVREHMKKLDKLGKEIAKGQREVASALGISA